MKKLGTEEYDYCFDPIDLATLPLFDQVIERFSTYSKFEFSQYSNPSWMFQHELLWLYAFSNMRVILQEHTKQTASEAYYPFRQRLEALEHDIRYLLATGILRASDDVEVLLLPELALENPLYLSLAEKQLALIHSQVGGDPAPEMTRGDFILLYELRLQILKEGSSSVCPSDYRKPSKVTREEWLYAHKRGQIYVDQTQEIGMWTIFASQGEIDSLWKHSARATSAGELGIAAKVSTARPKKTKHRHEFVLYVYTQDYRDQQDIFRVRSRLAEFGVTQEITYRQNCSSSKLSKPQVLFVK